MKKVEGAEDQAVRAPANGRFEGVKIRDTTFVLEDDLPVDDCRSAVKFCCCLCYRGGTLGPSACLAALDDDERAVAVMLDFMDPACTWRRMIDCRCQLRLDELQRHA